MRLRHLTGIALILLAACAAQPTIHTNLDKTANLASFKTYAFPAQTGTDRGGYSTPITSYFKESIRRQMDSKGYQYVESGDADLMVNFNANAHENVDIRSTPGSYYGYRAGLYGGWPGYSTQIETVRYKVGTANVDVVDARKKQLVWEGVAEGELSDAVMKDPRTAIDSTIAKMFLQFGTTAAKPAAP